MEYRLSQRFTTRNQPLSDFFAARALSEGLGAPKEGIRAVLVEKDRKQPPGSQRERDYNTAIFI